MEGKDTGHSDLMSSLTTSKEQAQEAAAEDWNQRISG